MNAGIVGLGAAAGVLGPVAGQPVWQVMVANNNPPNLIALANALDATLLPLNAFLAWRAVNPNAHPGAGNPLQDAMANNAVALATARRDQLQHLRGGIIVLGAAWGLNL